MLLRTGARRQGRTCIHNPRPGIEPRPSSPKTGQSVWRMRPHPIPGLDNAPSPCECESRRTSRVQFDWCARGSFRCSALNETPRRIRQLHGKYRREVERIEVAEPEDQSVFGAAHASDCQFALLVPTFGFGMRPREEVRRQPLGIRNVRRDLSVGEDNRQGHILTPGAGGGKLARNPGL